MKKRKNYNRLLKKSLRAFLLSSRTLTGTRIVKRIEYNSYPAPTFLLKAMELKWAKELLSNGSLRLSPLSYYQALESAELGDKLEGLGEFSNNNGTYSASTINEVFVWCGAMPSSKASDLLKLDDNYNVIIKINNVSQFVGRIALALEEQNFNFAIPHIGEVYYNRSSEVPIEMIRNQMIHWNSFQKEESYSHQKEYRLVLSDLSFSLEKNEEGTSVLPIDLSIGNCADIIQIV